MSAKICSRLSKPIVGSETDKERQAVILFGSEMFFLLSVQCDHRKSEKLELSVSARKKTLCLLNVPAKTNLGETVN